MTIVSLTALHPKPDASWEDMQTQIRTANELVRKHGGENVTTLAGMAAGPATGTVTILSTSPDWSKYGTTMDSLMADPDMQALMVAASAIATWDTYVLQTIPDL
jgi:hypothetical protein